MTSRMLYYKNLTNSLRELRNVITHSEGCITGRTEEESIRAYCLKAETATIDERDNVVLSGRFITNNACVMEQFIKNLHGKLKRNIASHNNGK